MPEEDYCSSLFSFQSSIAQLVEHEAVNFDVPGSSPGGGVLITTKTMQHPMEGLANSADWRYEPQRMALREECLSKLLREFGSELNENGTPVQPTMNIYDCAHDWVSQGNKYSDGVIEYFKKHYDVHR